MEALVDSNLTRHIGVANFNVQLLTDVLAYAVKPCYLNQVEMHPYNTQRELLDFCNKNGVKVTAFSPLGSPSYVELGMDQKLNILTEDCIVNMATKHAKSSAQILLRWAVQVRASVRMCVGGGGRAVVVFFVRMCLILSCLPPPPPHCSAARAS
jgi:diketogulonate reductase-like aldo/keto reductase